MGGSSHGGVDRGEQRVRLRGAGARGVRRAQLLDELPGGQGPQEVQGVLPDHVRRRVGEQGRQALQLRAGLLRLRAPSTPLSGPANPHRISCLFSCVPDCL